MPRSEIACGIPIRDHARVNPLAILRIKRIGILVLIAVLLGQGSILVHDIAEEHEEGEPCHVCTINDRPVLIVATTAVGAFIVALSTLIFCPSPGPVAKRLAGTTRSRGPPIL